MFIATNVFRVVGGKEGEFEQTWRERQSYLKEVPGFVQFALLKGDADREYISHSTWESRDTFVAWTQSEAFAQGHRQGSLMGILEGPPALTTYESVIVETPEGRTVAAS